MDQAVQVLAEAGFRARVEESLGAPFGYVVAQTTDGAEVVLTDSGFDAAAAAVEEVFAEVSKDRMTEPYGRNQERLDNAPATRNAISRDCMWFRRGSHSDS